MQLGMIGLGPMGTNMVRRLMKTDHDRWVYDRRSEAEAAPAKDGGIAATSPEDCVKRLRKPHAVWMMVPVAAVDATLEAFVPLLEKDEVPGNGDTSYYRHGIGRTNPTKVWG